MKKTILFLLFMLSVGSVAAQETTDDCLSLVGRAGKTLDPGSSDETYYVTVHLDGKENRYYTGCQMEVVFPDGVEPVMQNNDPRVSIRTVENGLFPSTKPIVDYDDDDEPIYGNPEYTHAVHYNYLTRQDGKRVLRIGLNSTKNEDFAKYSGDVLRFWVRATSFAKPQDNALRLENVKLITSNAIGYVPRSVMEGVTVTSNASTTIKVSAAAKWSTCIIPFDSELPEGVQAFTSDKNDENSIFLKPAETLKAFTPYVLYSETGFSGNLEGIVDASLYPEDGYVKDGNLNGAIVAKNVSEGYVLQNLNGSVMFYVIGDGDAFTIPAGKCWMTIDSATNAKSLGFVIGDASGIRSIETSAMQNYYTLQGVKLANPLKNTIVIKNGKKYLVNQ